MDNLIRNPNLTSSHLFRADVLYDSDNDKATFLHTGASTPYSPSDAGASGLVQHIKPELRPKPLTVEGFQWRRTVVRQLVPRNRQLDRSIAQTCHFFDSVQASHDHLATSTNGVADKDGRSAQAVQSGAETRLVFYLPHVDDPDDMPFYHPQLQGVCFAHVHLPSTSPSSSPAQNRSQTDKPGPESPHDSQGGLAIHVLPYATLPLANLQPKLDRVILNLLTTITKHSHGKQTGYRKKVHHDVVIPQPRFQDTYARLKETYARRIIEDWREVTDPGKHVFEDLGIASFLIELWRGMYGPTEGEGERGFPGFVDIGCGNGLLVYLLREEGFEGWGFDVRKRKSWEAYPAETRGRLMEMTLVPDVLQADVSGESHDILPTYSSGVQDARKQHNGIFKPGTFIISNHADELTAWTPLLGYLNNSPWIAIPCCSHDLGGRRFRAPKNLRSVREKAADAKSIEEFEELQQRSKPGPEDHGDLRTRQAAETGSLKRREPREEANGSHTISKSGSNGSVEANGGEGKLESAAPTKKNQMPSAYASLCSYVAQLAEEVGFRPETEMLRIPSTRNACIVGRQRKNSSNEEEATRRDKVKHLIEHEMNLPIAEIRKEWLDRAGFIAGKKGEGH